METPVSHKDDWTTEETRALAARAMQEADSAGPIS
jgi:hypothetical protein